MKTKMEKIKIIDGGFELGSLTGRYTEVDGSIILHLNFGRHKKGKQVDTRTIYDAIIENHETFDDVWLDVQDKQAIGLEIHLRSNKKEKKNENQVERNCRSRSSNRENR